MKICVLVAAIVIAAAPIAWADSLDIGGIELQLGMKADDALRLLSSYQTQYIGGSWVVTQKSGTEYEILGQIEAKDNLITLISKSFQMKVPEDAPATYTRASKEQRRLGGNNCTTREVPYSDGLIRSFETQCGIYTLVYIMPARFDGGVRSLGGVTITVKSR